jgi:hypothetical protein
MVLTTHAVAGAAVASLMPNHPVLGFVAGFGSHFLLDAIPHSEYSLASVKLDPKDKMNNDMIINKKFFYDILKIAIDVILGITVCLLVWRPTEPYIFSAILWGAIGGITPDALQFVYWKLRCEPFTSIQHFHHWVHSKRDLDNDPTIGAFIQILLIFGIILIFKIL